MKSASIFSVVFATLLVGAAAACTNTVTKLVPAGDGGEAPGSSTSSSGGGQVLAPPLTGDDDDTTADGGSTKKQDGAAPVNCDTTANQQACESCCGQQHPKGFKTYQGAIVTCTCNTTCNFECTPTATVPNNLCATPQQQPTADCLQCANDRVQSCAAPLQTACNADPDCVLFNDCLTSSSCGTKPAQ